MEEPINVPDECRIELYWRSMPGETPELLVRQFHDWLGALAKEQPATFDPAPVVEFPIRRLPGSALARDSALSRTMEANLDSAVQAASVLLRFVLDWCGRVSYGTTRNPLQINSFPAANPPMPPASSLLAWTPVGGSRRVQQRGKILFHSEVVDSSTRHKCAAV